MRRRLKEQRLGIAAGSLLPGAAAIVAAALALAQPASAGVPDRSVGTADFPFEENVGQLPNGEVEYFARGLSETVFITGDGSLVYLVTRHGPPGPRDDRRPGPAFARLPEPSSIRGWALKESFVGSQHPRIRGTGPGAAKVNYFKGQDPSAWRIGLSTYDAVLLEEIYPGIQLSVARRRGYFEKTFTVSPGADCRRIAGRIDGADRLRLRRDGALEVTTGLGSLTLTKPVAYQVLDGSRRDVRVRYVLHGNQYGFRLGDYDRRAPVIIDPLLAATFLGASSDEGAYAVSVDAHGSVYVAGYTYSSTFPTTPGAFDTTFAGPANRTDAFISQFTNSLTELVSSTIVGGNGADWINDLFTWRDLTTGTDYVFATGLTGSTDFPTSPSAFDRVLDTDIPEGAIGVGGRNHEFYHQDAFVVKFSRNLDTLPASTYVGGWYHEEGTSLYVTREGNVYVTGWNNLGRFPVSPLAFGRGANIGSDQAVVAKLDNNLTRLLAGTYLGTSGAHYGRAIFVSRAYVGTQAVDQVYVAGETRPFHSDDDDFPTTQNAYDRTFNGGAAEGDAFVSKFDENLQYLLASTFLGGAANESAWGLLVNSDDTVFVAGYTQSADFPTTEGAFDTSFNGNQDAFVSRFDANLQTLMASTFLGGSGWEAAWSIDKDCCGNIYVAGESSTDRPYTDALAFPTTPGAPDRSYNGATDAILSMFDRRLESLFFSTFAGLDKSEGSASSLPEYIPDKLDTAFSIAVDNVRNAVFIAGVTSSGTVGQSPVRAQPPLTYRMFPVLPIPVQGQTTPKAHDITYNGGEDVFAAKYGMIICRRGGDLNGDGAMDIVWRNTVTDENYAWFMNATTRMSGAVIERQADVDWKIEGVADFNEDGLADLFWRHAATGENLVWYMNGATRMGSASLGFVGDPNWQIGAVADFNSDGHTDVVWRNYSTGEMSLWLMNRISISGSVSLGTEDDLNWMIVAAGDLNGDGFSDIILRHASTGLNYVWYFTDTTYTGGDWIDSEPNLSRKIVLLADLNADGKADILWRDASTGENTVWFMSGVTRTGAAPLEKVGDTTWIIATQLEGGTSPVPAAVAIDITTPTTSPSTTATTPLLAIGGSAASVNTLTSVTWSTNRGFSGGGVFTTQADGTGTRSWKADIPLVAGSNAVTVTATDSMGISRTDTVTVAVSSFSYYLAEGATGPFFDLELALANPNGTAVPVNIQYLRGNGSTVFQTLTLAPSSRETILVDEVPGLAGEGVSAVITSLNALPLAVERTMTWDASGYGSHTEKATPGANLTWYFAEGSEQPPFDTYLLLGNPQSTRNRAHVEFLVEGGSPITKDYDLLPTSRTNVLAQDVESPPGTRALLNKPFGIVVTFDQPGVAERAMYFGSNPFWTGGHESAGVNAPSTSWYHAEGATGPLFEAYILLSNPNSTVATVTLRFLLDTGATVTRVKTVAPNSRITVFIAGEDPLLANAAMATQVTSDVPIVSERAMYWAQFPNWYEAHNSFGVTATGLKWGLGEGRVGGPNKYETYILLANPGTTAATVKVTYLREDGLPTIVRTHIVNPTTRFNVYPPFDGLQDGERFGALIESTVPIAVERAMYSSCRSTPSVFWAAGTNATATPIP